MTRMLDMPAPAATPPARRPAILVADDDTALRSALARLLPLHGFSVIEAADGSAAVETFRTHRSDIGFVLLDVCMGEVDGPAALEAIRAIDPDVPAAFMTAHSGRYTRRGLLGGGATAVLPKPFSIASLCGLLAGTRTTVG